MLQSSKLVAVFAVRLLSLPNKKKQLKPRFSLKKDGEEVVD